MALRKVSANIFETHEVNYVKHNTNQLSQIYKLRFVSNTEVTTEAIALPSILNWSTFG